MAYGYRAVWRRPPASWTCVENGIPMKEVDMEALWEGYDLAYPGRRVPEEVEEVPVWEDTPAWNEYWDWSAYM